MVALQSFIGRITDRNGEGTLPGRIQGECSGRPEKSESIDSSALECS